MSSNGTSSPQDASQEGVASGEQHAESELGDAGEQASATLAERHEHAQAALQALVEQYHQSKAEITCRSRGTSSAAPTT